MFLRAKTMAVHRAHVQMISERTLQMVACGTLLLAFVTEGVHSCKTTFDLAAYWDPFSLASPNYPFPSPRNEDICWRLSINPSYEQNKYVIRVSVQDAVLGKTRPCLTEDNVVIYDGDSTSSSELRQLCKRDEPGDVTSTGSFLLIRFRTSSTIGGRGFSLTYWAKPKLPVMPANTDCTKIELNATNKMKVVQFTVLINRTTSLPIDGCWQVETDQNQQRIYARAFLSEDSNRQQDGIRTFSAIEIRDGSTSASPVLLKTRQPVSGGYWVIFGRYWVTDAYSTTTQLYVRVHLAVDKSLQSHTSKNFRKHIAGVGLSTLSGQAMKQKAEECRRVILRTKPQAPPSVLTSPQYPLQTYAPYNRCWVVGNAAGHVCLRIVDFYVKASPGCQKNYLEIRQGSDNMTSTLLHRWCGVVNPEDVGLVCVNQTVLINYHVEDLPVKGFSMLLYNVHYAEPPGHPCITLKASNKTQDLESPDYNGTSVRNLDLCWVIETESPQAIVHVEMIDQIALRNCIGLSIRDGNSTGATLLNNKCENKPRYYRSTGTQMYLRYQTTTESNLQMGFKLQFMEILRGSIELKCVAVHPEFKKNKLFMESPNHSNEFHSNYTSNMDVCWIVHGFKFDRILNFFTSKFELESSSGCSKDYLEIMDGSSTLDPVLWKGCGKKSFPRGIFTKSPYALVRFHSNNVINAKGFRIYALGNGRSCQKLHATNATQFLTSSSQKRGITVCWILEATEQDSTVHVELDSVTRKEKSRSCKGDFIMQDGRSSYAKQLHKYLHSSPVSVGSTAQYMYIGYRKLNCDFKLRYYTITKAAMTQNITKIEFERSATVVLKSPGYPEGYPNDTDKCWQVTSSEWERKNPVIEVFDSQLEASDGCTNDYIEIRDGANSGGDVVKRWCGETLPKPVVMPRPYTFLCFHSNHAVSRRGFSLTIRDAGYKKTCSKNAEVIASRAAQYIVSPGYPNQYAAGLMLCWTILMPVYTKDHDRRIHIEVEVMDLEAHTNCSYDSVEIKNGYYRHYTASLLAKWCGNTKGAIQSIGLDSKMYVIFRTDSNKNYKGFKLRYWLVGSKCSNLGWASEAGKRFSSPGYPEKTSNIDICWTLRSWTSTKIKLRIDKLLLSGNCSYDYVEVRGGKTQDSPLVVKLCADQSVTKRNARDVTISSNYAHIRYRASNSGGKFNGTFRSIKSSGVNVLPILKIVVPIVGLLFSAIGLCCGGIVYMKKRSENEQCTEMSYVNGGFTGTTRA